jgi:hypothetical protein
MTDHDEIITSDEGGALVEEFSQDSEHVDPLINWRLVGTVFLVTLLIISIVFNLIGPAIIKPDLYITLPAVTPTPNIFIVIG